MGAQLAILAIVKRSINLGAAFGKLQPINEIGRPLSRKPTRLCCLLENIGSLVLQQGVVIGMKRGKPERFSSTLRKRSLAECAKHVVHGRDDSVARPQHGDNEERIDAKRAIS
ncbi:hypothetical protein JCM17846_33560 [Iodidimonas nitroreducens]|uniref:Uncharacterized protein n=1 Tax=Iodidimonas nitroreducens TaxID=1236968 RepID=A0A5A7ND72_9PROT|nr:hypothetical protein JCM17846_33560 [Iodidimonas nitroreducens]